MVPSRSLPLNSEMFREPTNEESLTPLQDYQSLIGSLLYIARHTRLEISVHVNLLGRRTSRASHNNMQAALQVLRYLMSTWTDGLTIQKEVTTGESISIQGFADASYRGGTVEIPIGEPDITIQQPDNMELPKARYCGYVDHRSRVYRLLRDGQGYKMATTTTRGSNPTACTSCNACRQRGGYQTNQNANIPLSKSTYRTPTPLYQRNSGPQTDNNERDSWERESGRSPYQASPDEQTYGMEEEDLFQRLLNEWVNE